MEIKEILKLIDAGYTKSEIEAMTAEEQPVDPKKEQPVDPKKEQPVDPKQTEAPVVDDKTEKRLEQIETMLSLIAANGISNSRAPLPEEKRNVVAEVLEHL